MDDKYKEYLLSPEWKEFRKKAFEHYGRKCSKCKRTKNLQVHHLHYKNIFNEQLTDVVILCRKHHELEHGITEQKPVEIKLNKKQRRKAKKLANRIRHLQGKPKKVKFVGSHKPHFNKKVKGNHQIKTKFPTIDAIRERKEQRENHRMRVIE